MIDIAVIKIAEMVGNYLGLRHGTASDGEKWVTTISLVKADGNGTNTKDIGRVNLQLVSIEEDRLSRTVDHYDRTATVPKKFFPEVKVNLFLLFSSDPKDTEMSYCNAMSYISSVIAFFQSHPQLDPTNTPSLPEEIRQLAFEMQTLSFEQQSYMWGMIGAKYRPSVLYRMRVLIIQDRLPMSEGPAITTIEIRD